MEYFDLSCFFKHRTSYLVPKLLIQELFLVEEFIK